MLKIAQAVLLLALVFGYAIPAKAALLIEPILGYNLAGKLEFDGENILSGDSYSGGKGGAYGGRLGYQNLGFQLGIDYLNSTIDMGDDDIKSDLKTSEWAAFVGFEFPILFRVYAGYIFSANGETEDANGELDLNKGSGTKVGVGFTGLPFIDINFEYRKGKFEESKTAAGIEGDGADYSAWLVSLSLPFTI